MVPDLENIVGVVIDPIQAVKAFDGLQNLYEILVEHYTFSIEPVWPFLF